MYYYHGDHLGSTNVVTDASGASQGTIYYYPFGATSAGDIPASHKYTSQEFDAETGLYNYNARLYNPSLGRFISPDTIVPDPSNPQAFNRYSYVINNPINYTDPSGHDFWSNLKHEAERPQNAFAIQWLVNPAAGAYFLSQSNTGRQILVGEAIIGAALVGLTEADPGNPTLLAANGDETYYCSPPTAIDWPLAGSQLMTALEYGSAGYVTYEGATALAGAAGSQHGGSSGAGGSSAGSSSGGGSSSYSYPSGYFNHTTAATSIGDILWSYKTVGEVTTPLRAGAFFAGIMSDKLSLATLGFDDSQSMRALQVGVGIIGSGASVVGGSYISVGVNAWGLGSSAGDWLNNLPVCCGSTQTTSQWWSNTLFGK